MKEGNLVGLAAEDRILPVAGSFRVADSLAEDRNCSRSSEDRNLAATKRCIPVVGMRLVVHIGLAVQECKRILEAPDNLYQDFDSNIE